MIGHGEVWTWFSILVTKLVDMKELVALAALLEDCNTAWGKIERFKAWFQLLLLCFHKAE